MKFYIADSKNSTQVVLDLITKFSSIAGHKVNTRKSVSYTNRKFTERESRGTTPFTIASKRIEIIRNQPNEGSERPLY